MQDKEKAGKKKGRPPEMGRRRPRRRSRWAPPARVRLRHPVVGMESEFNVILDGAEIDPRAYWGRPLAFIDRPLLQREKSSYHLPTGGAVYFDRGVIEVVTPVIELAPGCTARMVRNLWECIGFVREQLTAWQKRTGHDVRLKAYSTHFNVSYEVPRAQQRPDRNARSLALLLAYLLPIPVAVVATNRRSTGVGVRPRGNRIEVTLDFTPDPGLMIAAAALVTGIVREVMAWPSYALAELDRRGIPIVAGVDPGKHTTRKGWLTKDHQYAQSPYTCDVDERLWCARDGRTLSLRAMAREVAWTFRHAIRRWSDPFSFRLLFAVLDGRSPSLLELPDRPLAYEDVGRLCRWGMVLPDLAQEARRPRRAAAAVRVRPSPPPVPRPKGDAPALPDSGQARAPRAARRSAAAEEVNLPELAAILLEPPAVPLPPQPRERRRAPARRKRPTAGAERRRGERRRRPAPTPFPDRRLTRSAYEKVFLKLVSGDRLRIGRSTYTPVGMRGWFHAVFRNDADGRERLLSIDDLLKRMDRWQA